MRKPAVFTVVFCLAVPGLVLAAPWEFDPAHTGVHFKVRHLMVSHVRGDFEKFTGMITYDESDVTKSTADITIEAASINTRVAKRDEHLRSPDFLDVAKYPAITFKSKKVEKAGDGRLKVTGDLTIKGVTREAVLDVEGPTPAIKDPQGNTRVGGSATTKINRKDFGLTWQKVLEAGGVTVGDDVDITIDLEIFRKPG
ncbi:MAG: periplasmic protein YceI [Deltaproteobacteria bacterium]|jgi:polyisoprenoid-binding protein YceI|nr:periplasmic protein YceI [Deltaproteobacteria bacterium]